MTDVAQGVSLPDCDWLKTISRLAAWDDRCPPKAKVTRSNRIGCANKSMQRVMRAKLKLQICLNSSE